MKENADLKYYIDNVPKPRPLRSSLDVEDFEASDKSMGSSGLNSVKVKKHPAVFRVKKANEIQLKDMLKSKVNQVLTPENVVKGLDTTLMKQNTKYTNNIAQRFTKRIRHSTINPTKMKATTDYWK
jgi:hypothetical protein